jgi:predicted peptidase
MKNEKGKSCLAAGVAILFFLLSFQLQAQLKSSKLSSQSFSRQITKSVAANYLLYLPKNFSNEAKNKYPLLLFLHGSGERGTNLDFLKRVGLPKLIESGKEFEFIVVAPQCPDSNAWSVEILRGLLDEIQEQYSVDTMRIYLTGMSMGGWGAWNLAIEFPKRFAAVAPVCGRVDRYMVEKVFRLKNVPVWVFHGAKDDVVPISISESMVNKLKEVDGKVRFTIYPEGNHNAWDETYANEELYEWMLRQRRQ